MKTYFQGYTSCRKLYLLTPPPQWHHQLRNKPSNAPTRDRETHSNHREVWGLHDLLLKNFKGTRIKYVKLTPPSMVWKTWWCIKDHEFQTLIFSCFKTVIINYKQLDMRDLTTIVPCFKNPILVIY